MTAAVRLDNVSKRFPGVQALSSVSLEIAAGSVHALCGENGAGKSTLGKLVAGIHAPDEGELHIFGKAANFTGPRDALAAGVAMVHQELAFCENLSVAENLCLGSLPRRGAFVDRDEMHRRAIALLAETGTVLDAEGRFGDLSIGHRQMVQIAAAVGGGAKIIVFDEPTSSLTHADAERLYALIGRLKARGVTCIYVSHRMPEIFALCDTVSVLRDGQHVATRPTSALRERDLVQLMIGRPIAEYLPSHEPGVGSEVLRVDRLSSAGRFRDVSFSVRAGEVLGLAGLMGAGRSEVAQALFGLDDQVTGGVTLDGREVRFRSPLEAMRAGVGLVPEDRKKQGLVMGESVKHNASLPTLERMSHLGWLDRERERSVVSGLCEKLRVRHPGWMLAPRVCRVEISRRWCWPSGWRRDRSS